MESRLPVEIMAALKRVGNTTLINDESFSKILAHAAATLTQPGSTGTKTASLSSGSSKGDIIKDAHCALLSLFIEATRQDVSVDSLQTFLEIKVSWPKSRSLTLSDVYVHALPKMQASLLNTGFHPAHIVDVHWGHSHNVKSSTVEHISKSLVNVQLETEGPDASQRNVNFVCTLPELQDLVSKLKEALRQIECVGQLNDP